MSLYKNGWGFELRTTENKSSKWSERHSNPGPTDCVSEELATRPRLHGKTNGREKQHVSIDSEKIFEILFFPFHKQFSVSLIPSAGSV